MAQWENDPVKREQEQKDAAILRDAIAKLKADCFDSMARFLRMSPEELPHTGHKTVEAAIVWTLKRGKEDVERMVKVHLKKWPD